MRGWVIFVALVEDLDSREIETESKKILISVKSNDQGRFFKLVEVHIQIALVFLFSPFISHSKGQIGRKGEEEDTLFSLSKLPRPLSVCLLILLRSTRPFPPLLLMMKTHRGTSRMS